jgi:HEAT repeat protein
MEPLSPQIMHKLVFTILVHGLPDTQTAVAFEVLGDAQSHPNPQVRELAVVALAELPISPAKRVTALAKAMQDDSARVRRRAARALGDFGMHAVPAIPVLTAGLRDVDASVRRDSAGTLGRLGVAAVSAAPSLVGLLADPDVRTRVVVSTALKRIGDAAIPALLEGLKNPVGEVRARAISLLAHIDPDNETVGKAIRAATADNDSDVRGCATAALERVSPHCATLVGA